jgi:Mechanosensitive ion channel
MQLLRTEARRSDPELRRPAPSSRTRFPCTRLSGSLPSVGSARHLHSPRARAWLPLLAAPLTVSLAAVLAAFAGLSSVGVVLVAVAVGLAGGVLAHRAVSRFFAGAVLLLARPFVPGDRLRVYVAELGGVTEAELVRVGLLTTTLCTDSGVLIVPTGELLRVPPPAA